MVTSQWAGVGPHGQTLHCQCVNKTNIHLGVYLHSRQLHIPHFIPSSHLPCSSKHWHMESSETLRMLHLRHSRWNNLALFPTSLSMVISFILFSALKETFITRIFVFRKLLRPHSCNNSLRNSNCGEFLSSIQLAISTQGVAFLNSLDGIHLQHFATRIYLSETM